MKTALSLLLPPLFLAAAASAQDGVTGTHSTSFDPKYDLPDKLLINPQTHPALFSFTGRWLLSPARPTRPHAQLHQSTLWPSSSVTVLVHGANVSVQVVPDATGWVDNYHFFASVDSGPDVRYDLPPFNSSELTDAGESPWFDIDIAGFGADTGALLLPHTLRLTSARESPLWLEGVNVQRALVAQGREWLQEQDRRVVLEFITDTDTGGPNSTHYRVAELLGVRHSHSSAGTCFLPCTPGVPGLVTQYFQTSPHPVTAVPIDPHLTTPYRFPALSNNPPVAAAPSTHLLLDLDLRAVSAAELGSFIAQLRMRAHPYAMIIVVARPGTRAVVAALGGVQMVVVPEGAAETAYLRVLCPLLGRCQGGAVGGGGAWGFGALAVGALAVWSSRGIVVGAAAAVCGRRRIGIEAVTERDKRG